MVHRSGVIQSAVESGASAVVSEASAVEGVASAVESEASVDTFYCCGGTENNGHSDEGRTHFANADFLARPVLWSCNKTKCQQFGMLHEFIQFFVAFRHARHGFGC